MRFCLAMCSAPWSVRENTEAHQFPAGSQKISRPARDQLQKAGSRPRSSSRNCMRNTPERFLELARLENCAWYRKPCLHWRPRWRISSLQRWRFRLTGEDGDLERAVSNCQEALDALRKARVRGGSGRPGRLAQVYLINLLLLRMRDGDRLRPDTERYQPAILELKALPDDDPLEISWLHWYQAIALADAGDRDAAIQLAQKTVTEDAGLKSNPEYWEIGRRQYALICSFIEQYSEYFRDPSILGAVSQIVQASMEPETRAV
jgi:tetratricopeptide (TPR) repeat protein